MFKLLSLLIAICVLAGGFATPARADVMTITGTLPNYDGNASFGPFPASIAIGNFTFAPPTGDTVIGGTVSGTFGNTDIPGTTDTSAPADLFIDNGLIEIAGCDDALSFTAACDAGPGPSPFSYSLTPADVSNLAGEIASGSIDLSAVQNSVFAVNLGALTLDLTVVPEPASIALFASMVAGLALLRRFRIQ